MMLQAVEAPVLKLVAIAGAALVAGAFATPPREPQVVQRLQLFAPERPNAIYETAWAQGDVFIKLDGKPTARTFQKRSFHFGCEWLSVEVIVPDGPNRYFYSYDEEKLWCADGAPESIATPRTGYAVVVDEQQR
jgi:hypothetical protein